MILPGDIASLISRSPTHHTHQNHFPRRIPRVNSRATLLAFSHLFPARSQQIAFQPMQMRRRMPRHVFLFSCIFFLSSCVREKERTSVRACPACHQAKYKECTFSRTRNEPVNKVTGRRFLALGNKYSFTISAGENDFGDAGTHRVSERE